MSWEARIHPGVLEGFIHLIPGGVTEPVSLTPSGSWPPYSLGITDRDHEPPTDRALHAFRELVSR